jgi:hypothetical protein
MTRPSLQIRVPDVELCEVLGGQSQLNDLDELKLGPSVTPIVVVPTAPVTECIDVWRTELKSDYNAQFILEGLADGFKLIDPGVIPPSSMCSNYKSASLENATLAEIQIQKEIDLGRYVITDKPARIISAIGCYSKIS